MKRQLRNLILIPIMSLFFGLTGKVVAQDDVLGDNPQNDGTRATIYFDLRAGNVEFTHRGTTGGTWDYKGYVYKTSGGTTSKKEISGTYNPDNTYYIYQSQTTNSSATSSYYKTTGLQGSASTPIVPTYTEMTCNGKTWREYITNNSDVEAVMSNWETRARAVYKEPTTNRIIIQSGFDIETGTVSLHFDNIIIDGIWSDFNKTPESGANGKGAIHITTSSVGTGYTTLKVKGDCRLQNIYYQSEAAYPSRPSYLKITSNDGDGKHTGTLTVIHEYGTVNHSYDDCLSIIGARGCEEFGLQFAGATVYAGYPAQFNNVWRARGEISFPVCVGGGSTHSGEVSISGGTLTAVANGTSAAIGGGGGYNNTGGYGKVTISGGRVYAYAHGVYSVNSDRTGFVPTTAIGGASTFIEDAFDGSVITITGGEVYAESVGGAAIGGGNARNSQGGNATVSISGNAKVTAYSTTETMHVVFDGTDYGNYTIPRGTAIGGGVGQKGGAATVNIGSSTVHATSIGGGDAVGNTGVTAQNGGTATITVTGGTTTVDGNIGGGNTNGAGSNGGNATIEISGGSLTSGTIGGGSATTGHGGDASIKVTGGSVDCTSIGGGNVTSNSGTPGAVTHSSRAGFYVNGSSKITVKAGSIGGGSNPNGTKIGKATAYINATHAQSTIQGQFILCDNSSTSSNHCYFTMEAGTIDNTNLGAIGAASYPRKKAEGGAVYMEDLNGVVTISGGTIRKCTGTLGGAIYMTGGSCTVSGSSTTIGGESLSQGNTASQSGGGVYMAGGTFTMEDGNIKYNQAINNDGGGIYVASGGQAVVKYGNIIGNEAKKGNGGGFFVDPGSSITTNVGAGTNILTISGNKAKNGAGAYLASGEIYLKYAAITDNVATADGGGIYAEVPDQTVILGYDSYIQGNRAKRGGGLFANAKQVNVSTIEIGGSGSGEGNYAEEDGGGIYATGDVQFDRSSETGGRVYYNTAHRNGGGVYVGSGKVTLAAGNVSFNVAETGNGGGIYAGGGEIIMKRAGSDYGNSISSFYGNQAVNGGALYMNGGTCDIEAAIIGGSHANRNKATTSGGAIYANGGTVNIKYSATSEGVISYNTAGVSGGGLFVSSDGTLNMTGDVTLSKNHVPAGKHGGGVYLAGVISIGSSTERTVLAQDNFASGTVDTDPGSVTIDATNRNNVYLPNPTVNTGHKDVITVVKNGLTTSTRVGFSVPANFVPVIYCNENSPYTYLQSFLSGGAMATTVFDDSEKYTTVHISNNSFYDPQHIYLSGGTWVDHVNTYSSAPEGFSVSGNNITISSSEGLAWLIKYINGIAPVTTTPQSGVNVILTADLDMGDYAWVPMGYTQNSTVFTGTFDGQGHTISNLICQYLGTQTGTNLGLFGTVGANAMVKNVQLKDAKVNTSNMDSGTAWLGGIAGQMTGGVVESCVVDAKIETLNSGSVMGGIVGNNGAMVRSCFATADMTGYQMGGLVGANSGDLYNSYAYSKFDHKGGSTYFGGLVGVNTGRVENCYSRVQGTAPTSTYFGWLAGNNTSESDKGLYYSYSPNATYVATASETTSGNQTGLSTFGVTAANAYDYRVRDNQVSATNDYAPTYDAHHLADYQLKKYLNNWVEQDDTHKATYAGWTRPTTQTINDDYPLLKLQDHNAVAATSGEVSLEYGDINTLLTSHSTAANSILFYGSKEGMDSNSGSAATLYIDENAVLTPSTAKEDGDIVAHVGITLDNSACHAGANPSFGDPDNIDWHFFSSALTNAQIGLEYDNPNHAYGYWDNPPDPQFTATSQYFPMNLNSYYGDWDLYSYCERDYHWINLKRNSFSHWHEDADWVNIPYPNETVFNPGQGFMVATKEDCYLQAYGTLNNTSPITRPVTCTSGISWTTRQGQNLLGNPYQSYLDFDAFANDANNKTLWSSSVMPFYIIMDEDKADYVTYTKGQTANEARASRYLHPHQGFMIKINNAGNAKFDNTMRKVTMDEGWSSTFRGGDRPNYALVNLFAQDANGNRDMVTVELGRPEAGGLKKALVPSTSTGRISCYYEDEDYDLAFTELGITEASIHFKTEEDTEYTMTWSTQHGDFGYLHLIDNMTGADIDCLSTDEYRFSSRTSDYESRFRLVFGYTGIEEPEEDGPSTGSGTCNFAFMMGGQLVVNGEGTLQMFDVTGRLVSCIKLQGEQNTVSLPTLPAGVYMLRLEGGNGTQTQKIVIR